MLIECVHRPVVKLLEIWDTGESSNVRRCCREAQVSVSIQFSPRYQAVSVILFSVNKIYATQAYQFISSRR